MKFFIITACLIGASASFAQQPKNAPELLRGCEVLAKMHNKTSPEDAVHAAYCLGLMDGAFNQYYLAKAA